MMNIAAWTAYGPPSVLSLRQVPIPEVSSTDILVRVKAAGVAGWDTEIRALAIPAPVNYLTRLAFAVMRPQTLGQQFVGVVEKVGDKVTRFKKGDKVYGTTGLFPCAYAQFLVVSVAKDPSSFAPENFLDPIVRHVPSFLSDPEASLLPLSGSEALSYVTQAGIGPTSRVLLVGAAGNVGIFAAQIAKRHLGAATVVAVDVGSARTEMLRALGCCDQIIDAAPENNTNTAADQGDDGTNPPSRTDSSSYLSRFPPASFDVIIDMPGVLSMRTVLTLLAPNGLYLPIVPTPSNAADSFFSWPDGKRTQGGAARYTYEGMETLEQMAEKGLVRVVVDKVFGLDRAREAHEHFEGKERRGCVAIVME
ncbi:GroES-like protein [Gonapodya prolifera JEL478]|uniref:GroES-like protein n=1 Tax=Gonapodya prolifera (strain JEL478) TaxID=1344416 RepID=A0A139A8Z8_GONPJ|nr:GroES-like protein [Gonapodya prolifera JEL478]|eukprot:KXS13301.1 GroES-like protein [Gonapodya prolifera JEL478]